MCAAVEGRVDREGSREKGCRSLADGLLRGKKRERKRERDREREGQEGEREGTRGRRGDGWIGRRRREKTETQRKTVLRVTRGRKILN